MHQFLALPQRSEALDTEPCRANKFSRAHARALRSSAATRRPCKSATARCSCCSRRSFAASCDAVRCSAIRVAWRVQQQTHVGGRLRPSRIAQTSCPNRSEGWAAEVPQHGRFEGGGLVALTRYSSQTASFRFTSVDMSAQFQNFRSDDAALSTITAAHPSRVRGW